MKVCCQFRRFCVRNWLPLQLPLIEGSQSDIPGFSSPSTHPPTNPENLVGLKIGPLDSELPWLEVDI